MVRIHVRNCFGRSRRPAVLRNVARSGFYAKRDGIGLFYRLTTYRVIVHKRYLVVRHDGRSYVLALRDGEKNVGSYSCLSP